MGLTTIRSKIQFRRVPVPFEFSERTSMWLIPDSPNAFDILFCYRGNHLPRIPTSEVLGLGLMADGKRYWVNHTSGDVDRGGSYPVKDFLERCEIVPTATTTADAEDALHTLTPVDVLALAERYNLSERSSLMMFVKSGAQLLVRGSELKGPEQ